MTTTRMIGFALAALLPLLTACGVLTFRRTDFPDAETGVDGQVYILDDLQAIADDPDLTADEKRQAYRDLGIEDEDLITALLNL